MFNVLLQVLDDGRLTDGQGRTVNFRNTVVLMTSNIGSQYIQAAEDLDDPEVRRNIDAAMRAAFKPEFLNRIDDIVVFKQLGREQIATIIDVQLEKLRRNLEDRGITLTLDDSARDLIIAEGYDPVYGARPLKRAIQSLVQNQLAVSLLKGEIVSGQTVRVSAENGEMRFTPADAAGKAADAV